MSETEPIPPTSSVTALRIPIIKKGEYDLWSMKMRHYEHECEGVSNSNSQNIAFLSTEVKGSTLKQSTAEPTNIPKGYTQAASSKDFLNKMIGAWSLDANTVHFGQDDLVMTYTLSNLSNPEEDLARTINHLTLDLWKSDRRQDKLSILRVQRLVMVAFGNDSKVEDSQKRNKKDIPCLDFGESYSLEELKFNLLSVVSNWDKNAQSPRKICLPPGSKEHYSSGGTLVRLQRQQRMKRSYGTEDWGHATSKISTKLVKGNLVRGYLQRHSSLNHSCVACKRGKQHRQSCKKYEGKNCQEIKRDKVLIGCLKDLDLLTPSMNYNSCKNSLAKAHNDDQTIAFEEGKEKNIYCKGKENKLNSTFTLIQLIHLPDLKDYTCKIEPTTKISKHACFACFISQRNPRKSLPSLSRWKVGVEADARRTASIQATRGVGELCDYQKAKV
ncbi:hypothetical protein Tco_0599449 [Tanacetum coccineum]